MHDVETANSVLILESVAPHQPPDLIPNREARGETLEPNYRELYQALIEHAHDAIMIVQHGQMVYRNATHEKWFGFAADGNAVTRLLPLATPEKRDFVHAYERALCQGNGVPKYCEMGFHSQDGRPLYLEVISQTIMYQNAPAVMVTLHEVSACLQTSHEQTDLALRRSEAHYRTLYNQTPVMMVSIDPHGHILNVNDYWLRNLGYTRDEVLGHQSMAFMTAVSRRHAMTVSRPRFLQTGAVHDVPYQMVKKNGEVIDVLLSGIAERDTAGEIIAGHAFMVDVTAQKRAEATICTLQRENRYLQDEIKITHNFEDIIGTSPALLHVLKQVEQVAGTDTTVLITGETGTGKELIVRALHHLSSRKDRPLIKVNCTALSAGLIESELFGHEKGAFTGAIARKLGRFELADGGTLFLDEIGDMPLEVQAKLLRVLQEGEFERVGSSQTLPSNVRVIAATNRELKQAVAANEFRADLFYRLHVFPIHLPPVRQRAEDIPLLVQYFVDKYMRSLGKQIETIETATMERLIAYPWPGNIRELEHLIERALILTRSSTLVIDDALLSAAHVPPLDTCVASTQEATQASPTLEEVERDYIVATLETTGWVVEGSKGAARILDLHPNTLRGRMRRLGISRPCRSV